MTDIWTGAAALGHSVTRNHPLLELASGELDEVTEVPNGRAASAEEHAIG
ncbi:MAG: hypothetical protein ACODAF_02430 [Actinomycetota bacterium]